LNHQDYKLAGEGGEIIFTGVAGGWHQQTCR